MKTVQISEFTCLIGQNSLENWNMLELSKQKETKHPDLFFHLSSFPSCYVILQNNSENIPDEIITECAKLCVQNTKYRNRKNVLVDYTPISNVKKGEELGEIYYINKKKVKTICV